MTLAETYSWILYAIGMASHSYPATPKGISREADEINHAVPTHKELQASILWLEAEGLIKQDELSMEPTTMGREMLDRGSAASNGVSEVWRALTSELANMGVDDSEEINPSDMNTSQRPEA
jgi:hypothetical protein